MAIHIDVIADLDRRQTRDVARDMQRDFQQAGVSAGREFGRNLSQGIEREMPKVERAMNKAADATGKLRVEQERYDALVSSGSADRVKLITQSERLAKARREEEVAVRNAASAHREFQKATASIGGSSGASATSVMALGAAVRGLSSFASPIAITAITSGIAQLGGVAAAASGSIGLLPGVAGAAASAFGTLKIATLGFSDALENMSDPEKFAEALRKLSPNAQQAALSIQNLMPAFERLKTVTQDSLFAGVGQQLNQLTNQLLPTVQQMTTGIAGAFNQMFMGVTNQLMSPDTMASLNEITNNVVNAFRQLAPAAAPFTKALTDLTAAGTSFLPELARGATSAAQAFSQFIAEARQSGQLDQWIRTGLDTMKQLGPVVFEAVRAFMALAPIGVKVLPDIAAVLHVIAEVLPTIVDIATAVAPQFWLWRPALEASATMVGTLATGFQTVRTIIESIPSVLGPVGAAIDVALGPLDNILRLAAKVMKIDVDPKGVTRSVGDGGMYIPKTGAPTAGIPGMPFGGWSPTGNPGIGAAVGRSGSPNGTGGPLRPFDIQWGQPAPYDPNARSTTGVTESETDRRERIRAGMDPNAFSVPINPVQIPPGSTQTPTGPGNYIVDQQAVTEAQQRAQSEAWDVQNARMELAVLEQDTLATEQERLDARRKLQEEEWQLQNAQVDLAKAQQGTFEKLESSAEQFRSGMQDIGAELEADMGLSGGIPGFVEFLTKAIANIAAAPLLGQLDATRQLAEAQGQPAGGHGLLGIMGAQNIMQGKSPILGRPLPYDPSNTSSGSSTSYPATGYSPTGYSSSATSGYPGDATLLSAVPAGRYTQSQEVDLTQGLADCSSAIEDLVNLIDGQPTGGRSMSTHNADEWLASRGFLPGKGGPGDFRVGFNSGHMQATLPGGTPFNWGSDSAAARRGIGGTGADDPAFTSHYYRPAGGGIPMMGAVSPGAEAGSASFGGGSIPIPLPVTIVGGAAAMGPAALGGGLGASLGAGSGWSADWNAMAQKEASGNWSANTGNGFFGGLQFTPSSWEAAGGTQYAPRADLATPEQQMLAGEELLKQQGPGAWPNTFTPAQQGAPMGGVTGSTSRPYSAQGGAGAQGLGGLPMAALSTAASGLDMLAPGAGQAAQIGMQLANRTIGYLGQLGGIAASGWMETLIPNNSEFGDPGKSWLGKLAGGLAGARPAVPNKAGQETQKQQQVDPNTTQHGQGQGQPPGPTNGVYIENMINQKSDGQAVARDIDRHRLAATTAGGVFK